MVQPRSAGIVGLPLAGTPFLLVAAQIIMLVSALGRSVPSVAQFAAGHYCLPCRGGALSGQPVCKGPDMSKMKTNKATKKRFRLTASGKVKHRCAGTSHLAFRKSKKRRRNLRGTKILDGVEAKRIREALAGNSY